jgi:NAD(P)-dependent dehydrogenase (short-subunit alcohol dehydrogenase family)
MPVAGERASGHVIVTGAAGGIGQALVRGFADAGYGVIATDRCAAPEELPCEYFVQADLQRTIAEPDYAETIFKQIRQHLSNRPLKALINNAAVQILGPADKLSRQDWRSTLDVNLLSPFFWTQAFLPELEACHGTVLNISSIHARLTKPEFVAYATSKAALSGLTRAMAVELGIRVRINAIEPAAIDTPMLRAGFDGNEHGYQQLSDCHPTTSIGKPEELALLARMIVESNISFLNGAVVDFSGGLRARLHDPA